MEKKLESNPLRPGTKGYRFLEMSDMDYDTGHSRVVLTADFPTDLNLGNGGSWCRDDSSLGKYFNITRNKKKGRIISVQLTGYKKNIFNHSIHPEIYNQLKNSRCCILDISHSIEIDHKDGRYDNYKIDLDIKDCQTFHSSVNKAKRQHCKKCKETGVRYDARRLGFPVPQYIGPENYNGSCIGCLWYDPYEFYKQISKDYIKKK